MKYAQSVVADQLKDMYIEQIKARQQNKADNAEFNAHEDREYLSQFRTAKDLSEFRHTTGNMGMLFSKTQMELDRLQSEKMRNAEVWRKSKQLN